MVLRSPLLALVGRETAPGRAVRVRVGVGYPRTRYFLYGEVSLWVRAEKSGYFRGNAVAVKGEPSDGAAVGFGSAQR